MDNDHLTEAQESLNVEGGDVETSTPDAEAGTDPR